MTRKLITTLLCLVLAVALPLAALADTRHTLTLIPGDDLSAVPAIADLCDALSLTLTKGEKSGGLTLSVGGEDIATVALGNLPESVIQLMTSGVPTIEIEK